jgi:aminoglycoside 3-N-acetyltransferase
LKLAVKSKLKQLRVSYAAAFRSYGREELLAALRALGVRPGDTVMLHSAYSREHGFKGSIGELIDTFIDAVGPEGHLLMVSMPYRNASLDWLLSGRRFDVRKTPSMMGMVTEVFRRRPGVQRSLHPTHPILVHGAQAGRFIDAHPRCLYPCGPGTPFDEVAKADGVAVFFNVPIDTFTFFHYLEHMVKAALPFALYTDTPIEAAVIDAAGEEHRVRTYAFARDAIRRRRPDRLYDALRTSGKVASQRVGATRLLAVRVRDAIACTQQLQRDGVLFYDTAL